MNFWLFHRFGTFFRDLPSSTVRWDGIHSNFQWVTFPTIRTEWFISCSLIVSLSSISHWVHILLQNIWWIRWNQYIWLQNCLKNPNCAIIGLRGRRESRRRGWACEKFWEWGRWNNSKSLLRALCNERPFFYCCWWKSPIFLALRQFRCFSKEPCLSGSRSKTFR